MVKELELQNINLTSLKEPPIHVIGQIQPYGVLLVLEEPELKILQFSSNTSSVFGILPEELLQKKLEDLLDPFQIERIKAGLLEESLDFINPVKIWLRRKGDDYVVFDGVFHRNSDNLLILELEPAISQENIPFLSIYHLARASINRLEETGNTRDLCQIIVQEVRKVTGFDRVMLYKFDNDGHGSVQFKLDQNYSRYPFSTCSNLPCC
jgi:two-component system, chemotaxis family, sensor kinase Cph1